MTDEELAQAAAPPLLYATDAKLRRRIARACATARAQGRADALAGRGEATTAEGPTTAASPSAPARGPRQGLTFTDSFLADAAFDRFNKNRPWSYAAFMNAVTEACATARAEQRDKTVPATEDMERVAAALWRAWWRTHGEHEPSFQFSQLYESARQRWVDIAAAGFEARDEGSAT